MHQAVDRECTTVREVGGVFDASTLGKIEVVGPDAAEFLNLHLHQRLGHAEARPLPLRHHDCARTVSFMTTASSGAWPKIVST